MYPFGYGLSYTTFDWSDYNTSWDGDTCTVTVKVTNTGSVAGKDVVEVYAQSPYTDYDKANKVEKAAVELVGYAKTSELAPGASETVTVTFDQEQLKSYDYTTAKTYILDAGDYYITAAKNAHDAVNNILAAKGKTVEDGMTEDGNTDFVATYTPANGTVDTTTYKNDTTTGVRSPISSTMQTAACSISPAMTGRALGRLPMVKSATRSALGATTSTVRMPAAIRLPTPTTRQSATKTSHRWIPSTL